MKDVFQEAWQLLLMQVENIAVHAAKNCVAGWERQDMTFDYVLLVVIAFNKFQGYKIYTWG